MARPPRDDRAAERLCGAIRNINTALQLLEGECGEPSIPKIRAIGELALQKHTEAGYKAWEEREESAPPPPPGSSKRRPRALEEQRRRLFRLCTPEMILAPANVVEVYLAAAPMWESWDWTAMQAVNARMLPLVQQLDPSDPLPDDPRLALPLTVAGFMLYRALHVDTAGAPRDSVNVVIAVYEEIARAIVILDRCFLTAASRKIKGEVSEDFLVHFAGAVDTAQTLLFHAVRLGPEMWDLILQCPLGAGCKRGEPYYVARPNGKKPNDKTAYHPACRVGKLRTTKAQERVTLKPLPKKK